MFDLEDLAEDDERHPYGFPLPLMEISPVNHSITVDYEAIDRMFSSPEIADRKMVAVSVIGALRKGKSFFMNYCLRYMYANVSDVMITELFLLLI